jgi:hypothetical protein
MLALLHGGWDTIVMGLLFWAVLFGTPVAVMALIVRYLYLRYRKKSPKEEKFPSWR